MGTPRNLIVAVTVSVWLAAAGSAAALTYELGRPLVGRSAPVVSVSPSTSAEAPALDKVEPLEASLVYLPSVQLLAPRPHLAFVARAEKKVAPRDISVMNCADWRDLDMGSGHVQVCQ